MPRTAAEWDWAIERIHLNFGDVFSTVSREGRILDVGCGVGYLEHYLLTKGFTQISAIDVSAEQIQMAQEKLRAFGMEYAGKVAFHVAPLYDYLNNAGEFDVITMIDILEHCHSDDAMEILKLTFHHLRPEGLLMMRVPAGDNPLVGGAIFYNDFTHRTIFTRLSLGQCLEVTGYSPIRLCLENQPVLPTHKGTFIQKVKVAIRLFLLKGTEKILGVPLRTTDIIAVAKK